MTAGHGEVMLVDPARTVHLCDVGLLGWCAATTVAPDGSEHLLLVDRAKVGAEDYSVRCTAVAHEQCGPLPAIVAARVGLTCGAPARTNNGQPCRNRVPAQGQRCPWHKDVKS